MSENKITIEDLLIEVAAICAEAGKCETCPYKTDGTIVSLTGCANKVFRVAMDRLESRKNAEKREAGRQ